MIKSFAPEMLADIDGYIYFIQMDAKKTSQKWLISLSKQWRKKQEKITVVHM